MTVDLSRLAPPPLLDVDAEQLLGELMARFQASWPEASSLTDADPASKLLQLTAFYGTLLRQQVNEGAEAVMLARAVGANLDQLAANVGVTRAIIDPGDPTSTPPRAPTYESDERLRARAQQAFEGLSVAGPVGAYRFHAMSASPDVEDVDVTSPSPGRVRVYVLARSGNGLPSQQLLATVATALNADKVRPLTDLVEVLAGTKIDYAVSARLEVSPGPDASVVRQAATAAVTAYTQRQRRFQELVTVDGLHAALWVEGVRRVFLDSPTSAITPGTGSYANCTSIAVGVA